MRGVLSSISLYYHQYLISIFLLLFTKKVGFNKGNLLSQLDELFFNNELLPVGILEKSLLTLLHVTVVSSHEIKTWEVLEKEESTHLDLKVNSFSLLFLLTNPVFFSLRTNMTINQLLFKFILCSTNTLQSHLFIVVIVIIVLLLSKTIDIII